MKWLTDVHEPTQVRVLADQECEEIFVAMRAGEMTQPDAWAAVQRVTAAMEARVAQLSSELSWGDIAAMAPAPRWPAARLSDHQLASAVLRDDGHYRTKVSRVLRARLSAAPATSREAIQLIREYLVG